MPEKASPITPLVGRDQQLSMARTHIDAAKRDRGPAVVFVYGVAGSGKSRLLDAVVDAEADDSTTVLRASCGLDVPDQPFGLVRTLVQGLLDATVDDERWTSLRSRLESVRSALCTLREEHSEAVVPQRYALLHELCLLVIERSTAGPLLIAVDDLHRCDPRSAQWLDYLVRRAWGKPVILVAALRKTTAPEILDIVREHMSSDHGTLVVVGRLGRASVAELVTAHLGAAPDAPFLDACCALSCRQAALVVQVLELARAHGVRPRACAVERLTELTGDVVASHVRDIGAEQPRAFAGIARAVAVLESVEPQLVSALSGASVQAVSACVEVLRDHGILGERGELFPHELVRETLLATEQREEVARLRVHAARLLNDAGRTAEAVARLLLPQPASFEPWMRAVLWDAARDAETRGDTDAALRYLWPLLEESPGDIALRGQVGELLARVDPCEALEQLRVAIDLVDDRRRMATLAIQFGFNSLAVRRPAEGLDMLTKARTELRAEVGEAVNPADRELCTMVDAAIGLVGFGAAGTFRRTRDVLVDTPAPAGATHAERLLLAVVALAGVVAGRPVATVLENARRAVPLDDVEADDWSMILPSLVLAVAGEVPEALSTLDRALSRHDDARPAWTYAFSLALRALVRTMIGDFTAAATDAEEALRLADFQRCRAESATLASVAAAAAAVRLGDVDRARTVLDSLDLQQASESPLVWHNYLMTRAGLHAAMGEVDAALDCYRRCGACLEESGIVNPLITEWWYEAALLLVEHQRAAEAEPLVKLGERLAESWPVPRARGMALVARAAVAEPKARVDLLTEANDVLADSFAQFDLQRAEFFLGRALLDTGDLVAARQHLRRASALAVHCGARTAAEAARELVLLAGGRMRDLTGARTDMLTDRELEVARAAAGGASNREIAEALFVTARTVEVHLTSAYRKLGLAGRDGLATALEADPEADGDAP